MVVFGSFLSDKENLGDLDLAVKHRDRSTDADVAERALDYADRSGRTFGRFIDRLAWSETELYQILKARKRTIIIQPWNTFLRLVEGKDSLRYKVVFGDPNSVQVEVNRRIEEGAKAGA